MLIITVIVQQGNLYRHIGDLIPSFEVKHFRDKCIPSGAFIQHFHKFDDTSLTVKTVAVGITIVIFFPQVIQGDTDAAVQVGQFP